MPSIGSSRALSPRHDLRAARAPASGFVLWPRAEMGGRADHHRWHRPRGRWRPPRSGGSTLSTGRSERRGRHPHTPQSGLRQPESERRFSPQCSRFVRRRVPANFSPRRNVARHGEGAVFFSVEVQPDDGRLIQELSFNDTPYNPSSNTIDTRPAPNEIAERAARHSVGREPNAATCGLRIAFILEIEQLRNSRINC